MFALLESMAKHGEIPATFDGQSPEAAFGLGASVPQIGQRIVVPGPDGVDLEGTLEQAVADERNGKATAIVKQDDGTTFIAEFPLSEVEVNAYRRHPKTFFGTVDENAGNTVKDHYGLFLFFLKNAEKTSREDLITRMQAHVPSEQLAAMSTEELCERYAEGMTWGALHNMDSGLHPSKE
jgi:hypothetical protein